MLSEDNLDCTKWSAEIWETVLMNWWIILTTTQNRVQWRDLI